MEQDESLKNKRKKLIFRSWHRGTREMDLIMGRFAENHIPEMEKKDLADYEELLSCPDPDIYNWVSGREEIPEEFQWSILLKLVDYFSFSKN